MDIGLMLKQSWQVVWQHKFLWVLGFFAGLTAVCFDFLRLFFGTRALEQFQELLRWAQAPQPAPFPIDFNFTDAELARIFIGFVIVFLVVFLGFWVVATVAEAGIIQTAVNLERGEAVGLGTAVRSGFHWLGRFVAIDALVFFPWFLLALCTMLLMIVLLLLVGYLGLNQAELSSLFAVVGIGLLCLIPLFLLLIPVAWLSFIYRTIAFRDAVLLDHAVRVSVRHTWQVVRRHLSTAVLVTLLMVAVQSLANWVVDLISLPIFAGLAYLGADSVFATIVGVLLVLVTAVFSGIIYAYIAVAWTLSYKNWTEN